MSSQLATLEQQVKEMSAEIERLKLNETEDSKPSILWKPKSGEEYHCLNASNSTSYMAAGTFGHTHTAYDRQQLFATKEETEFADRQRIAKMKVLRRVAELNHKEGWVCDWDEYEQWKFSPSFYMNDTGVSVNWVSYVQQHPTAHYAAKGIWETVISEMAGDVKLGLWGIE